MLAGYKAYVRCALVIFDLDEYCSELVVRLGYGGRGITVGGRGALEISEGVFVVFQALVEVGFAEEAGLLVGDVSESVGELSYTAGRQLEVLQARWGMRTDGLTVTSFVLSCCGLSCSLSEPSRSRFLRSGDTAGTSDATRLVRSGRASDRSC